MDQRDDQCAQRAYRAEDTPRTAGRESPELQSNCGECIRTLILNQVSGSLNYTIHSHSLLLTGYAPKVSDYRTVPVLVGGQHIRSLILSQVSGARSTFGYFWMLSYHILLYHTIISYLYKFNTQYLYHLLDLYGGR